MRTHCQPRNKRATAVVVAMLVATAQGTNARKVGVDAPIGVIVILPFDYRARLDCPVVRPGLGSRPTRTASGLWGLAPWRVTLLLAMIAS